MCTVFLPLDDNPIAVNIYIISSPQPVHHEPTQCILALSRLAHHPHFPVTTFTYVTHPTLSAAILFRQLGPEDENYSPSVWTSHACTAHYMLTHHRHHSCSSVTSVSSETLTYEVWHSITDIWGVAQRHRYMNYKQLTWNTVLVNGR